MIGSTSVVRALQAADGVDEYRLLVFPTVAGAGDRLFEGGCPSLDFRMTTADHAGPTAFIVLDRQR